MFAANNIFQINSVKFSHGLLLDLFITSVKYLVDEESYEPVIPTDSFHPAPCISMSNNRYAPSCDRDQLYFNFGKADFVNICSFIFSFDWCSSFSLLDLDSAVNIL